LEKIPEAGEQVQEVQPEVGSEATDVALTTLDATAEGAGGSDPKVDPELGDG
jgi:hypothetical protein